jgi:hypothetical protein
MHPTQKKNPSITYHINITVLTNPTPKTPLNPTPTFLPTAVPLNEPLNGLELELVVGKLDDDRPKVTTGPLLVVSEATEGADVDVDVAAGIPETESCWGVEIKIRIYQRGID